MTTVDELKEYYALRLIMQYRGQANAVNTIKALVQEAWLDGLIQDEASCFDIETASGAQLDVIGRIVGVPRNIYGLDLVHEFWEVHSYTDDPDGVDLQRYADSTDGPEIMLRYNSNATYALSEFEMRTLIKMKIKANTILRSTKGIVDAMFDVFGSSVSVVDNADMTLEFNVQAPYHNTFVVAEYIDIIPRPMGVAAVINNI